MKLTKQKRIDRGALKALDRRLRRHSAVIGCNGRAQLFNYALPLLVTVTIPATGETWHGTVGQALRAFA